MHPTRDGVIPWKTFMVMYGRLNPIWSLDTVHMSQAVGQAIALAFGDKNGPAKESYRKLIGQAFPEGEKG